MSLDERVRDLPHGPLRRVDPARNMARFYVLDLQRDLFGGVFVMREWGRIGRPGRIKADLYRDGETAAIAATRLNAAKRRRGYR